MPSTIEQAVEDGYPMSVINQATPNLKAMIEYELIMTAKMVNVDQRLTIQAHQIPIIAETLYETFKDESIEDISLCLKRGAAGLYGEIYRLDAAVITGWMKQYLAEKYQVVENNLMSEKENPYEAKKAFAESKRTNPNRNLLAALETVAKGDVSDPVLKNNLTPEQLKEIQANASKPAGPSNNADVNAYQRYKLFQRCLREATKEFYGKNMPADLNRYNDDQGHYLHAADEQDAEKIYEAAKAKMKS